MPEKRENSPVRLLTVRHRGRVAQIGIYFKKFLRMFVYQSDWKMLPMAAIIAGLVGFALGGTFGVTMEGTLTGAFAIVCVCIWNGSFNSIQVICRERDVIKREHRSGMHISSYISAHMMYQLLLCVLQTAVTLTVLGLVGLKFPGRGLFTPWLSVDIAVSMLLITYASDLLSLWLSTLVHSTTTAMTLMPFVLIFQLVFSGGLFALPRAVDPIVRLTISSPGLKAIASQTNANSLPYATVTDMLNLVDDVELGGYVTVGQVLDALGDTNNKTIRELRAIRVGNVMTMRDVFEDILENDAYREMREEDLVRGVTVEEAFTAMLRMKSLDWFFEREVGSSRTIGEWVDLLAADKSVQSMWDEGVPVSTTLGDLLDLAGRKETKMLLEKKASEALYKPDYATTAENIIRNWLHILLFIAVFALLSVITLEFIDKDKR